MMDDWQGQVLVVDDEQINRSMLAELLREECKVILAKDGTQALEKVARHHPDLILLDINMPELDGYQVLQRLQLDAQTGGIPVIFITAQDSVSQEEKGLLLGAVDYITKPFSAPVVKARVKLQLKVARQHRMLEHLASLEHASNLALSQTNAELNQTLEALRQAQKQVVEAEKMAALGGLVAGVAHAINTPLGVGVTAASTLHTQVVHMHGVYLSGKMKKADLESFFCDSEESALMITRNLETASELIHNFKQIAVERGAEEARCFDLGAYLAEVLDSVRVQTEGGRLETMLDCPPGIVVRSFPNALMQIVANLAANAVNHGSGPDGAARVSLSVSRRGRETAVTFSDLGSGIAPDVIGKIYDPFFTTRRASGSGGLGLHIVYNLVTQTFNGSIECVSAPGAGCTFSMLLQMDDGTVGEIRH